MGNATQKSIFNIEVYSAKNKNLPLVLKCAQRIKPYKSQHLHYFKRIVS